MHRGTRVLPYAYIAPAVVLMSLLSLVPNLYSVYLAFTNFSLYHYSNFRFVGLRNFLHILGSEELHEFVRVLAWTLVWAGASVTLSLALGLLLAVPLNNPAVRFRSLYRTLFIVPWAIPAFISVMMWKGLLNADQGAINLMLGKAGLLGLVHASLAGLDGLLGTHVLQAAGLLEGDKIPWLNHPLWARLAVLLVNVWLGFPFMMTVCLGALQSIPRELYESAAVDGAPAPRQFFQITLPMLRSALLPVLISSFAFNFNQFAAIYLLTGGGPAVKGSEAGATDILITYSYKLAFSLFQYGTACAYAIFIFAIVASLSAINFRTTGAFEEA